MSLDAQVTTGAWLLKLESFWRDGERDAAGLETDYLALVGGFEYTLYGAFDGDTDLGLLMEFLYDGRDERATVVTEEDVFTALRLAFNDEASTDILLAIIQDLDKPTRTFFLEVNRRLSDNITLGIEGSVFLNVDDQDSQFSLRTSLSCGFGGSGRLMAFRAVSCGKAFAGGAGVPGSKKVL